MKHGVLIFCFTILVTLFYNYVGHVVPQKEVYPPKSAELRPEMGTQEMVEAGKIIVEGKGTCATCHNGNARFPDFQNPTPIGTRAKTQRDGYSDVDYLAESLCDPNVFIVPPFALGMPPVNKPPIGLSTPEMLAVIAYLQSIGGTPTVTMQTKLKYCAEDTSAQAPPAAQGATTGEELSGQKITEKYGCMGCHSFTSTDRLVGPGLSDVGKRLSKAQLYEAMLDADATITPGFPPGLMSATLKGTGFYDKVSMKELETLVTYLGSLKG